MWWIRRGALWWPLGFSHFPLFSSLAPNRTLAALISSNTQLWLWTSGFHQLLLRSPPCAAADWKLKAVSWSSLCSHFFVSSLSGITVLHNAWYTVICQPSFIYVVLFLVLISRKLPLLIPFELETVVVGQYWLRDSPVNLQILRRSAVQTKIILFSLYSFSFFPWGSHQNQILMALPVFHFFIYNYGKNLSSEILRHLSNHLIRRHCKNKMYGVPLWHNGIRIWYCQCSDSACCWESEFNPWPRVFHMPQAWTI